MTTRATPKNLVLYADDDQDDIEMIKDGFAEYATNVYLETFNDGDEMLGYLQSPFSSDTKPCLIILDVNMPRMNGRDTLLALRKLGGFEDTPVIMFTTSSSKLDKQFAQQNNANFITKPIDINQLTSIINHFIDHCDQSVQKSIRR